MGKFDVKIGDGARDVQIGENNVMGDHNVVHIDQSSQTITIDAQYAGDLQKLAQHLAATEVDGLAFTDRLEGARLLGVLSQQAEEQVDAREALGGWRGWLKDKEPLFNRVAAGITIATPLMQLLGMAVS